MNTNSYKILLDAIKILVAEKNNYQTSINKLEEALVRNLEEDLHIKKIVLGVHECPTSLVGMCIYDDNEDPVRDMCIFCNNPYERK